MYSALKSTNWRQNLKSSPGEGTAILCGHPILYCAVPSLLELFQHPEYCFSPGDPNPRPPTLQSSALPLSNPASVLQFSRQIFSLLNTTVTYPYLHVTFWVWFFTVFTLDYPPLTCKRNMVLQIFPFQCNGTILVGAGNNFKLATIDVRLFGTIKNKVCFKWARNCHN